MKFLQRRISVLYIHMFLFISTIQSNEISWEVYHAAARNALERDDYVTAVQQYNSALREARGHGLQCEHFVIVEELGSIYFDQNEHEDAAFCLGLALGIIDNGCDIDDTIFASLMRRLSWSYYELHRYEIAEGTFKRAVELQERISGKNHPKIASLLHNSARNLRDQGKYERADELFTRALEIRTTAFGEYSSDVAHTLNGLANSYNSQGRYESAENLYLRALDIYERALGETHGSVSTVLFNLAKNHSNQGEYAEAEPLLQRALQVSETAFGPESLHVAEVLHSAANNYAQQGNFLAALPLMKRALIIRRRELGEEHAEVAQSMAILGHINKELGKFGIADSLYVLARNTIRADSTTNSNDIQSLLSHRAELTRLRYWGRDSNLSAALAWLLGILVVFSAVLYFAYRIFVVHYNRCEHGRNCKNG